MLEDPLLEERRASEGGASASGGIDRDAPGDCRPWTIRRVVLQESLLLLVGCTVLLVRMPFSIAMPYLQARVLAKLAVKDAHEVWLTVKIMAVAGSVDAVLDFWCVYLFSLTKSRMVKSLRLALFDKLLRQEIGFFDVTPSGELSSRLTTDIATLANDMTWVFRFSIEAVARILGVGLTLFHTDWRLALVTCTSIPLIAAGNRVYGVWLRENAVKVQDSLAVANAVAQEVLSCFRVVYSFANERFESSRYRREVEKNFALNKRQAAIDGVYYMLVSTFLMNTVVRLLVIGYGAHLYFGSAMDFEKLSRFVFFVDMLQSWTNMLFDSFSNLVKSGGASAKVFEILNREGGRGGRGWGEGEGAEPMAAPGHVSFENVSFSYPARPGEAVLRGVTFQAEAGKTLAIIGRSGSGKSTIVNLIENFYQPDVGRVLLDGKSVAALGHEELHSAVAIVNQDTVLFSGSIYDNIVYGARNEAVRRGWRGKELMPRVVDAARVANIHDFISTLPGGYDEEVGERGVQLSGGQRQRIAIARAVLADPRVLLLDEATSSLDHESEKAVKEALDRVMDGKTVVVVAHRLSTIMNANSILVMRDGEIADQGPPERMQEWLKTAATDMEIVD